MVYLSVLLFLVVIGCGGGGSTGDVASSGGSTSDKELLKEAIDDDYSTLFSTGVIEDDEEDQAGKSLPAGQAGLARRGYPRICDGDDPVPCWFRLIHVASRNITINIENSVADVSVTKYIEGSFFIDVDGDYFFGTKRIEDIAKRYARFERDASHRWGWKLTEISPVEISLQDEESRTITIKRITAYVDGVVRWEVTNPETMFKFPDELPHFSPGEEVIVEAEIENIDAEGERESYVYLHYTTDVHKPGRIFRHQRVPMYDDGTHGDEVAGDGIFTGTYIMGNNTGYHHAAVDVLDKEMFDDEETQNYNTAAWAMPYIVE
jgi:hypothetical protein